MPEETAAKDLRSPQMKQLYQKIQEQQKRLGYSDVQLCEFATKTLAPLDPYKKFKATTPGFLARLKPGLLQHLLAALESSH